MSLATIMMLLVLQIITSLLFTATASSSPNGFTIDLIHRRSNSSRRLPYTDQLGGSPYANTVFDNTQYLMKLQIGTPPFEIEVVIDTGSEILWTQCLPCLNCYNQLAPMFDPSKSSTYKEKRCKKSDQSCPYELIYGDGSYSKGVFATDTVTIQSTSGKAFVMPEFTFGCGHNNSGTLSPNTSGIVGLDLGALSLTSQMGEKYYGVFSYCFSAKGSSKINFGDNAIVSGAGTVSTDLFMKTEKPGYYYLNLDAISVGANRIETLGTPFHASDGNMIIDSGSTYTHLPQGYCNQVKEAVESFVQADRVTVPDVQLLCYNSDSIEIFPVITMHFSGGADLVLERYNMYGVSRGVACMTLVCGDPTQLAIFGNRAQNNILVGYDPSSLLVSFKPTDCSALWS
ncbi:hypothetical protein AALP_AA6G154000 [Arabis alpina]|uniref:Peptidase A1 domain-containing protein n=1 Tax=Arabis alpina TaxID=50452 RepID=A0A087GPE5_ARAAL|nr:hypothetical protein AALP_AA6G154000 [Arabis alpina]